LNDDDDLDASEANLLLQYETWTKAKLSAQKCEQLVIAAPKLALYAKALGESEQIGTITVGFTKKPVAQSTANTLEIYENEPEVVKGPIEETLHTVEVRKVVGKDIVIIVLPVLEPRDCYSFSEELFSQLKPSRVVILSASNFDSVKGGPLFGLYTSRVDDSDVKLPVLKPPAVIVGASASVLSKCEILQIPGSAIVVQGDGPFGHEVIDHDSYSAAICRAAEQALNLPSKSIHPDKFLGNRMFL
jgi:hypothetical protein